MPQQITQRVVNNFIKGLITEAGELNFPENASVDESNCDLRRDGSRRRRLGAVAEDNHTDTSWTISDTERVVTGEWENVGGQSGLKYMVVQKGSTLYFFNKASAPYSQQEVANTVDLTTYEKDVSADASAADCQFASVKGALVVASPEIDTIYIERDNGAGTISVTQIDFRIRDFEWQGDRTTYSEEVATGSASVGRKYDTANTGWTGTKGGAALTTYTTAQTAYPPLTLPWYSGKDASNNFSVSEWQKIFSGTSLTGNGHFILDFFAKDRETVSGVSGIGTDPESTRFSAVTSFGDRVFYAGLSSAGNAGTILFTRIIEELSDIGECLQQNDPTSEELSDLLSTDGGVIKITGCVGIHKLHNIGDSVYVFAENGVWVIKGVDGVFKATEYSIQKLTSVGIQTSNSFVSAAGAPFWWSQSGIHTLEFDKVTGQGSEINISLPTIQTFWDEIGTTAKDDVRAVYDAINKRIYWAWPDSDETVTAKLNNFLILDIPLQAFIPWTVSDQTSNTDAIVGLAFYSGYGSEFSDLTVLDAALDTVVNAGSDTVIITQPDNFATGDPAIVLLIRNGSDNKMTLGGFTSDTYYDWGDANYTSFAETGYDFSGDVVLKKSLPYVVTYLRQTATGWTGSPTGGYTPVNDSSCNLSAFWDFKTTASSTAQEVYRLKYNAVVSDVNSFDYPHTVITSRMKLRGRGRSLRLRFESTTGKAFEILGFGMIWGRNGRF